MGFIKLIPKPKHQCQYQTFLNDTQAWSFMGFPDSQRKGCDNFIRQETLSMKISKTFS